MLFGKKSKVPVHPAITMPLPDEEPLFEDNFSSEEEQPKAEPAPQEKSAAEIALEVQHMHESDLTTSISRNTVIKGNIDSEDNVEVYGIIDGSIRSSAVVKIYGKITGDIQCSVLVANGATIVGDITGEHSVVLGQGTDVRGNIVTNAVNISGTVNGNIIASESTTINSEGNVHGDITTSSIEVSKGAIVYGAVVMEKKPEPVVEEPAPAPVVVEEEPASVLEEPVVEEDEATPALSYTEEEEDETTK